MPDLRLVPPPTDVAASRPVKQPHDLPPRWDGHAVVWEPWQLSDHGSLRYHSALEVLACTACGSLNPLHWRSTGARALLPATSHDHIRSASAMGKGGRYALRTLSATRCLDCGHDQVYDLDAAELWDLDPSDYGDDGSVPPGQEQGQLW